MNNVDKVRVAVKNYQDAKGDLMRAETVLRVAASRRKETEDEMVRVLKLVVPGKGVIIGGQRFTVDRAVGNHEELIVEPCHDLYLDGAGPTV